MAEHSVAERVDRVANHFMRQAAEVAACDTTVASEHDRYVLYTAHVIAIHKILSAYSEGDIETVVDIAEQFCATNYVAFTRPGYFINPGRRAAHKHLVESLIKAWVSIVCNGEPGMPQDSEVLSALRGALECIETL